MRCETVQTEQRTAARDAVPELLKQLDEELSRLEEKINKLFFR